MSLLSKFGVGASIADFSVKKLFQALIGTATVTALGSTIADAVLLTSRKNAVLAADGAVGVKLPKAKTDMDVEIVNTVAGQDLLVYPFSTDDQINAITAGDPFTLVGGARGQFYCNADGHWYVAASSLTGTATTSSTAELNYLDIAVLGTGAASKAVVLDSGEDYTWPATGVLTTGVVKDVAGTSLTATHAELNAVADVSGRMVSAAGASLAVTAALHGGRIIAFDQTGGTAATLPAATGTGNVYKFLVKVKNTSSANTIVVPDASHLFQGQIINTDADATTPVSYTANAAGDCDTISLNGTTTGGQIGDWIDVIDVAANVYAIQGMVVCPAGSNVATPLLTGQVS